MLNGLTRVPVHVTVDVSDNSRDALHLRAHCTLDG